MLPVICKVEIVYINIIIKKKKNEVILGRKVWLKIKIKFNQLWKKEKEILLGK